MSSAPVSPAGVPGRGRGASFTTATDDGLHVSSARPKRRLSRAHASSPPLSPNLAASVFEPLQTTPTTTSVNPNTTTSFSRPGRSDKAENKPPNLNLAPPQSYAPLPIQKEKPPTLFGIELKWISLVTLSLQNAFLTIIMHYSRISTPPSRTYSAAAAVLLNELLKFTISSFIALKRIDNSLWEHAHPDQRRGFTLFHRSRLVALRSSIFSADCYKLAIPAILYVVQNNLQYVAASNLDVATFQVTYQMKILTTAFFSVVMLGKRLSRTKWGALVLLAVGVGIVQLQTVGKGKTELVRTMHPLRGFFAVTFACITSGIAGVYFELLVKSSGSADLWTRNTQLSLFSIIPALVPILCAPAPAAGMTYAQVLVSRFANFNGWALGTVATQTFGGLITAIVIKYSDNILKGFATSLSIVLSFLASVILFNYTLTVAFMLGASIVLAATFMYNRPVPERTSVAVAPGSPIPSTSVILGEARPPSRASTILNLVTRRGSGDTPSLGAAAAQFLPPPPPPPLSRTPSSTPSTPFLPSPSASSVNLHDWVPSPVGTLGK